MCKCFLFGQGLTLSQTTNLDPSKLKEFADDNFKFDENGRKCSERIANTMGKGEIAWYKQFLLYQGFQKASFPDPSKGVIVWEWVKDIVGYLPCFKAGFW